jgi:hypothetical protein
MMYPTGPRISAPPRSPRGLPSLSTLISLRLQLAWMRWRLRLRWMPLLYWIRFRVFVRTVFWSALGRGPRRRE